MKKKFDESFKEYICENPTEIFEHMKNARFAEDLFEKSGDLPFPFTLSMLTLLKSANPLEQKYYYIEDNSNYAFFCVRELFEKSQAI